MEVVLDSSFIISCIKRKIDFLLQLEEQGFKVLVPREVLQELKDLRFKVPHNERLAIDAALELLSSRKVKKMKLGHETVDKGLVMMGKKGAYIATLDSAIKRAVQNKIVLFSAQRRVGVA